MNFFCLFPSKPPLKIEILSTPPLFENWVGGSTPSPQAEWGVAHYALRNNIKECLKKKTAKDLL